MEKLLAKSIGIFIWLTIGLGLTAAVRGATLTQPDTALLHYGQKVRIPVTANDSNVTLSTLVIVTPPQYGQATPDTNGNILYIHTNGTAVKDTFTYQVNGPGGLSAATLVTVFLTNALRLPNTNLNIPANPPPTTYFFTNAFPTLSFSSPLCLAVPNGETNRLFVCEKGGAMKVVTNTVTGTPGVATFLNLSGLLTSRNETIATGCEQGLLGLTFHPGYNTNRYFYLYYSVTSNSVTYERLSRFTALTANPNAADTNSEVIYFSQTDTACNHNGGDLHFGPDGYLYISLGDGGDQNDTQDHAQKITNGFFSGLARIDVDKRPGNPAPNIHTQVPRYGGNAAYAVPSDNPYLNATNFNGAIFKATNVFTELYAVGLRNPWRFYIDFTTSNLWCGNVGQDAFEGVYLITNAQNCGWPYYEQSHPGPKSGSTPAGFKYTPPVWDYPHGSSTYQGNCMIGGILYRGRQIPSLYGYYLCADYVSGNCWALWLTNGVITSSNRIAGQAGLVGFTADPNNGDLLAANITSGQIVRLASATPTNSYPLNLSDTRVFADLTDLSPAPGVVNYAPNLPFWSDYAVKSRWFILPDPTNAMGWSADGLWTFPTNQIWIKHFDLEMERGNPATRRRLETRLLVRNAAGIYGVSYQWNTNQTDAALAPDAGVDFNLTITNGGTNYLQHWHIPSRAECLACHTAAAGYALSFNTRQLNRTNTLAGTNGNQLELLAAAGYFSNSLPPVVTLPHHVAATDTNYPLETRVRSYLDVNCSYCHRPGGGGGGTWDGRALTNLFATGIINGSAANNGGDPANRYLVPNDPLHSILLNRIAVTNGFTRMPPLASFELDYTNINLLSQWILGFETNRVAFANWQTNSFGNGSQPNAQPGADPDGDGLINLLEYYYGTDPLQPNAAPTNPRIILGPNQQRWLQYFLSPNANAQVQISTNLVNWSTWQVPGNDGLPAANQPANLLLPTTNQADYFRLWLTPR